MEPKHIAFSGCVALCLLGQPCTAAPNFSPVLVDFWDDASRTTFVGTPNNLTGRELAERRRPNFANKHLALDYEHVRVGSFSLAPTRPGTITLIAGLWGLQLEIPANSKMEFFLRPQNTESDVPTEVEVVLIAEDETIHRIQVEASPGEDEWTHYAGALKNPASLNIVRAGIQLPSESRLSLDGVLFRGADGALVGMTDRPTAAWKAEAAATRSARVRAAVEAGAESDFGDELRRIIDQLWIGDDPVGRNVRLREILSVELEKLEQERADLWSLTMNLHLIQLYFEFGAKSTSPKLDAETEKLLLEVLWKRLEHKNDIGWARSNTWWMTGSENHDLNAKVSCLLSARIFMNEPAYADRVYPNEGGSPGYGYWFHTTHGNESGYGPATTAPWGAADGEFRPADHYRAWVRHFREFLVERAKRGFFLENASNTYQKWSLGFLLALHRYSGDGPLQQELGAFFDIIWADWAQEQIGGLRGGPKTRHHHNVGGYDSMTDMARFYLGGPGTTFHTYSAMLFDDYAFPELVFNLALNTRNRGSYEIIKRGIGEEETIRPRPVGMERTMLADTESRLLKYSWVTPHYILGTQMDHPDAVHGHLSTTGRWHGMIVAGSPETRIVPTAGRYDSSHYKRRGHDLEAMWQTAQHRNVLVGQQARRWHQINPEWYPAQPVFQKAVELHVGKGWDETVEDAGWLFLQKGGAYVAVREVLPRKADEATGPLALRPDVSPPGNPDLVEVDDTPPTWNEQKDAIVLGDMFNPFIIHAGDKVMHGTFAAFRKAVLASRLDLAKTVVPGFYSLRYAASEDGNLPIDFPAATPGIPSIGSEPVNYRPDALFKSPYINSAFGSGQIEVNYGENSKSLQFPRPE